MLSDENLNPEQIYNADETALYWPSTVPLSHPVPYIVLSKRNVKIYTKDFPLREKHNRGFHISFLATPKQTSLAVSIISLVSTDAFLFACLSIYLFNNYFSLKHHLICTSFCTGSCNMQDSCY